MTTSRRDFIKTAGIAVGAAALPLALPAFISKVEAVEAAAAAGVDKLALADIALGTARSLGRYLRGHQNQSLSQRADSHARKTSAERFAQPEFWVRCAGAVQGDVGVCLQSRGDAGRS